MPQMVDAICRELRLRREYINTPVESIYFGGGTPSLLSQAELDKILAVISAHFFIQTDAEITLEANPDDISTEKLQAWKRSGINRFSLGVQSFADQDLQWMNRAHNAQQSQESIRQIQAAGFENITIDLIYGTPTLSDEQWQKNVETAIHLDIPHLSCYALTVEAGTALEKMIARHKKENTDTETQARHFEKLMPWLRAAGYDHYEVSNFGKPGFHSRHNSSYWQGKYYLGVGPSAHSFNGMSRQWNVANNAKYINALRRDELPFEIEYLTPIQQLNEYIMTSLRTMEGLSLGYVEKNWGEGETERLKTDSQKFIISGNMLLENEKLKLTDAGFLLADGMAAELFR